MDLSPNVLGTMDSVVNILGIMQDGAFTKGNNTDTVVKSGYATTHIFYFNAHNSNAIYTDNGKIAPLGLLSNYIIKV